MKIDPIILLGIAQDAECRHPDKGKALLTHLCRKAEITLDLHAVFKPQTWLDGVRLDFLAEVYADPCNWGCEQDAIVIALAEREEANMHALKGIMWHELRHTLAQQEDPVFRNPRNFF